jgi:hypothetical protein
VEVVHAVLGEPGPARVADDAPLVERGRAHAALHALDERDVLRLEDLVDVAHGLVLGFGERRSAPGLSPHAVTC